MTTTTAVRYGGRFVALERALEAVEVATPVFEAVPPAHRDLAEQGSRSLTSVALNLAEGWGRRGRAKLHHYDVARGEADETTATLRILLAARAGDPAAIARAIALLDEVLAMTWRLLHPR